MQVNDKSECRRLKNSIVGLGFATRTLLIGVSCSHAIAQPNPTAEVLFDKADRLFAMGRIGEACAAFRRSEELESNLYTALRLASCRERNRELASSWAMFKRVAREARKHGERKLAANATARAAEIEKRLSYLTVNLDDGVRIDGITVARNGMPVSSEEWGLPIPVDGGDYVITASAPGHESWSSSLRVEAENDRVNVTVPKLAKRVEASDMGPSRSEVHLEPARNSVPVVPVAPPPDRWTSRQKTAASIAAASVAASAVGIVFGLRAARTIDATEAMGSPRVRDSAQESARTANMAFAISGVAAIAAVVFWFAGDSPTRIPLSPMLPLGSRVPNGIALEGRF